MSNIVNLAEFKKKSKDDKETDDKPKDESSPDFEAIAAMNKAKAEKLAKERAQANNSVKRSYRLNPNDPNNKR